MKLADGPDKRQCIKLRPDKLQQKHLSHCHPGNGDRNTTKTAHGRSRDLYPCGTLPCVWPAHMSRDDLPLTGRFDTGVHGDGGGEREGRQRGGEGTEGGAGSDVAPSSNGLFRSKVTTGDTVGCLNAAHFFAGDGTPCFGRRLCNESFTRAFCGPKQGRRLRENRAELMFHHSQAPS